MHDEEQRDDETDDHADFNIIDHRKQKRQCHQRQVDPGTHPACVHVNSV